jgi:hypothetical protein
MIRVLPFLILLGACNQTVPMVNCSEDFRDAWWLLDPGVTEGMGAQSDVCIYVGSDGYMDIRSAADEVFGPYEWECADTDHYRVKKQGTFTATPADATGEVWDVDVKYHGLVNKYSYTTPCWFAEPNFYTDEGEFVND